MNIRKALVFVVSAWLAYMPAAFAGGALAVNKEVELNVPAADLWKLVGGFGTMQNWHPAVASTQLTGNGTTAGDKRVLTLGDGAKISETLEAWDGTAMQFTYIITDSPLPVSNYRSTISVLPAGEGKSKFVWSSTFDAKAVPDADATNAIAGVYQGGIDALKARFP